MTIFFILNKCLFFMQIINLKMSLPNIDFEILPLQNKVFSRWISNQLKDNTINNLTDLSNGEKLIKLAASLTKKQPSNKWPHHPKNEIEKIKACNIAINLFKDNGFPSLNITGKEIINNKQKLFNFVWELILHYSIKRLVNDEKELLHWANSIIKIYPNINAFTPYEISICALLDNFYPEKIHFFSLNINDSKRNANLAINVMKELNISIYIYPDDIIQNKIDEKTLLIQLASLKDSLNNLNKTNETSSIKNNNKEKIADSFKKKYVKNEYQLSQKDCKQNGKNKLKIHLTQSESLSFSIPEIIKPVINYEKKYENRIQKLTFELSRRNTEIELQKEEIATLNREADLFANTLNEKLRELTQLSQSFQSQKGKENVYVKEIDDIDEDEELLAKEYLRTQEENEALNREADLFANKLSSELEENEVVNREADLFANNLEIALCERDSLNREADLLANKLAETLDENKKLKIEISALNREAEYLANELSEKIDEKEAIQNETDLFVNYLSHAFQKNSVLNREAELFSYNLSKKIEENESLSKKNKLLQNELESVSYELTKQIDDNKSITKESEIIANKMNQLRIENSRLKKHSKN